MNQNTESIHFKRDAELGWDFYGSCSFSNLGLLRLNAISEENGLQVPKFCTFIPKTGKLSICHFLDLKYHEMKILY